MRQSEFACDVHEGLSRSGQKQVPAKYFYDKRGSELFEAITRLPEYGLARADIRLISSRAREIASHTGEVERIIELGSGSGSKTRPVLNAYSPAPPYYPIDIAQAALDECQKELEEFDVRVVHASYLEGLHAAVHDRRSPDLPVLLLFLGSTIGNFERDFIPDFLLDLRCRLRTGDWFLLGADLEKDRQTTVRAYDDAAGVTAEFNLNLLTRMNRELGANFELDGFSHEVRYDAAYRRIEMHLRSLRDQAVDIPGARLNIRFTKGETIWTESSHKFAAAELVYLGERGGFSCSAQWIDEEWPFAETLFAAR